MTPMRSLITAAALTAAVALPTSAIAAEPQPAVGAFDAPTVERALRAAEAAWTPNPCAGRSIVRSIAAVDAREQYDVDNARGFAYRASAAERDDCGFWLITDAWQDAGVSPALLCAVMAHELGHVLGLDHDHDPASVMYEHGVRVIPDACAAAFPVPVPELPPDVGHADPLAPTFRPHAPTPRLASVERSGRQRITLLLANANVRGRLVVTFYRHGRVLGCGGGGCRVQTPWELRGRIQRTSARIPASGFVGIRTPRQWTIATLRIRQPGARAGIVTAMTPDQVTRPGAPAAGCEFRFECSHSEG